ncbi:MAG: DUF3990 domain-containing protein [Lachnospiraceae bacterium]|nr:DUF3990 domain-containing protein [Lachnospiraceae bacterium]
MVLYHGTTLDAWENIQKYDIDVFINNNRELDFGYGFYLGEREYAKDVANEKAALGNKDEHSGIPVLLEFEIDIDNIVKTIGLDKCLLFKRKSLSFAKCIFNNRYNSGSSVLFADFVIAPLADGNVNNVMRYYKEKQTIFRKWVCYFNYLKPQYFKMKQYVFKKQGLCTVKNITSVIDLIEGRMLYEQNNEDV